jgi:hypothetical protein
MMLDDGPSADPAALMALRAVFSGKPPASPGGTRFFFGREAALALLERDLGAAEGGFGAIRFIVGDHGAGKTALLQELLHRARRKRFVTMHADMSRDCLFRGRDGEARALLEQALLNMRTLGSGDRSAMDALVGGFVDECDRTAIETRSERGRVNRNLLAPLAELVGGHDFIRVLGLYGEALRDGDEAATSRARRWLLAQYRSDSEARREVGASAILDAEQWTMIKLWARFARLAGRPGLVLVIDELRMLATLTKQARDANYAQLFRIFNDILSGQATGLGLFIAVTPAMAWRDFDSLCSEAGLASCLQSGKAIGRATDAIEPLAFQIADLDHADVELMLHSLRDLIAASTPVARLIPESDIGSFIEQARDQLGGQAYPLPRDLIRQFLTLHNRLTANPSLQWTDVLHGDVRSEQSFAAMALASGEFVEQMM